MSDETCERLKEPTMPPEQLVLTFDAAPPPPSPAETPEERRARHQDGRCQNCGVQMTGDWLTWEGGLDGWCAACAAEDVR